MLLAGKKVVVVGGSSGIGLATAEMAKREGAELVPASVIELPYQEGQWVKAGAVVVRLDDGALRAAAGWAFASASAYVPPRPETPPASGL